MTTLLGNRFVVDRPDQLCCDLWPKKTEKNNAFESSIHPLHFSLPCTRHSPTPPVHHHLLWEAFISSIFWLFVFHNTDNLLPFSPLALAFTLINKIYFLSCPPPINKTFTILWPPHYTVTPPPALTFSLSLHRHPYLYSPPSSRFICYYKNKSYHRYPLPPLHLVCVRFSPPVLVLSLSLGNTDTPKKRARGNILYIFPLLLALSAIIKQNSRCIRYNKSCSFQPKNPPQYPTHQALALSTTLN